MEGVDMDALAEAAGQVEHLLVDGGHVDRRVGIGERGLGKEGGHQAQGIVFAAVVERRAAGAPAGPHGAHRLNGLTHLAYGLVPAGTKAEHDVRLDLGAEAKNKAALAVALQIPGDVGQDGGRAREGDGDAGAQAEALGVFGGKGEGQEWVMGGFGGPEPVEAQLFGGACHRRHAAHFLAKEKEIELHGCVLSWRAYWKHSNDVSSSGRGGAVGRAGGDAGEDACGPERLAGRGHRACVRHIVRQMPELRLNFARFKGKL